VGVGRKPAGAMRIVIVSAGCLAVAAGFFVWAEFSTSRAFADASPKTAFV
jgi:hypothetical protein